MAALRLLWIGAALIAWGCQADVDPSEARVDAGVTSADAYGDASALDAEPPDTPAPADDAQVAPCPSETLEPGEPLDWPADQMGSHQSTIRCASPWGDLDEASSMSCLSELGLSLACFGCVTPTLACCPNACWSGTSATCALCLRDQGCASPSPGCDEVGAWPTVADAWLDLDPIEFEAIGDLNPEAIQPAREVDWWAFIQGSRGPAWSAGARCASATSPACDEAVEALTRGPFDACFESSCFEDDLHGFYPSFVLFTAGDEVGIIADHAALATFLAPVETVDEALLLTAAHHLYPSFYAHGRVREEELPADDDYWKDWTIRSTREVDDGFDLLLEESVNACPWSYDRVQVHVSKDGAVNRIRQQLAWIEDICS